LSEICAKAQNEKIAGGRPEIADILHLFRKADARRTQFSKRVYIGRIVPEICEDYLERGVSLSTFRCVVRDVEYPYFYSAGSIARALICMYEGKQ
jgi:hypothetical protein